MAAQTAGASAAAEMLYREGKSLLKQKEYDAACDRLAESQRLEPALGTLGLLALCHEMQGRTATAWQEYLKVASLARESGQKKRQRAAERQAEKLQKKLSSLRVTVPSPVKGLEVLRGGDVIGAAEWGTAIPVDPGDVLLEARAPGYKSWSKKVVVGSDAAKVSVSVPKLEISSAPAPPPAVPTPVRKSPPQKRAPAKDEASGSWIGENALGLVVLGVGAVGIGAGAFFGLQAGTKNDESSEFCNDADECGPKGFELRDDAKQAATISNIAFGVGAAGIGLGVLLIATSGGGEETADSKRAAALRFSPVISSRGGGAAVKGHF